MYVPNYASGYRQSTNTNFEISKNASFSSVPTKGQAKVNLLEKLDSVDILLNLHSIYSCIKRPSTESNRRKYEHALSERNSIIRKLRRQILEVEELCKQGCQNVESSRYDYWAIVNGLHNLGHACLKYKEVVNNLLSLQGLVVEDDLQRVRKFEKKFKKLQSPESKNASEEHRSVDASNYCSNHFILGSKQQHTTKSPAQKNRKTNLRSYVEDLQTSKLYNPIAAYFQLQKEYDNFKKEYRNKEFKLMKAKNDALNLIKLKNQECEKLQKEASLLYAHLGIIENEVQRVDNASDHCASEFLNLYNRAHNH